MIAVNNGAEIVGINNRDLGTFAVDLATTERLLPLIPLGRTVVSESGIKNRSDIDRLERQGVDAVLIGETLMASGDIAAKLRELL
jgi:indole-3-glycerol phosphate synthase